jgi:hypothetical protein
VIESVHIREGDFREDLDSKFGIQDVVSPCACCKVSTQGHSMQRQQLKENFEYISSGYKITLSK